MAEYTIDHITLPSGDVAKLTPTSGSAVSSISVGGGTGVTDDIDISAVSPITISESDGDISIGLDTIPVSKGGTGATTAANARTNLAITPANIGAAATSHTHAYVPQSTTAATQTIIVDSDGATVYRFTLTNGGNIRLDTSTDGGSSWTTGTEYFQKQSRTQPIANGGTGATTRLTAVKNLFDESITSPNYFLGITSSWAKGGYVSVANTRSTLGVSSAQLYSGTMKSGSATLTDGYKYNFIIVFGTAGGNSRESVVIPRAAIGTDDMVCLFSDTEAYIDFKIKRASSSSNNLTLTWVQNKKQDGSTMTAGSILRVYGVLCIH